MPMQTKVFRTYRFIDKDPVIDAMRTIQQDTRLKTAAAAAISGLSPATISNWFDGETRRPQNTTIAAYTSALGYVRRDRLRADGSLEIIFVKARDYDYVKEREKAATWLLKQNSRPKKRARKKKGNGHG